MPATRAALVLCVLFSTAACGFADGAAGPPAPAPALADGGMTSTADGTIGTLSPPMVDPLPASVCTDSVPVQGTAKPNASVIVFGGSVSALSTDAHPVTGRFCLDVPLVKGSQNSLQVRAQDPLIGMSDPVTYNVEQMESCTDDASKPKVDPVKSKNVALGETGESEHKPNEGNIGLLTDGDASTFVQYKKTCSFYNPKCHFDNYDGWVYIKLAKLTEIDRIVVKWKDNSGDFGGEYKVLVSAMSTPGDPDPKAGYWTVVADINGGDGGTDSHDLKSAKVHAQYVALWLENDSATSSAETFSIAELEVWDVPPAATPAPANPGSTCSSMSTGS